MKKIYILFIIVSVFSCKNNIVDDISFYENDISNKWDAKIVNLSYKCTNDTIIDYYLYSKASILLYKNYKYKVLKQLFEEGVEINYSEEIIYCDSYYDYYSATVSFKDKKYMYDIEIKDNNINIEKIKILDKELFLYFFDVDDTCDCQANEIPNSIITCSLIRFEKDSLIIKKISITGIRN